MLEAGQPPDTTGSTEGGGVAAGKESIWSKTTMAKVSKFADTVGEIKTAREALNARKMAAKTELIDMGFNADALDAAIKYANTPEDKRENFDLSYIYARNALGAPIQDDLFSAALEQQVKVTTTAAKEE